MGMRKTGTDAGTGFDYYYGTEAEQFAFYRVPRLLVKDVRFKGLSSDAKLLYGLMLDRLGLSMKNGWLDGAGRAYIYYKADEIMEDLGCSGYTCTKVLAELDGRKGIGLIERKRQGLGKPDIIYVKNFARVLEPQEPRGQSPGIQGSGGTEPAALEPQIPAPINYININNTKGSYTEGSQINQINQISQASQGSQASPDLEALRERVGYDSYMANEGWRDRELFGELYGVVCSTLRAGKATVRVGGAELPYGHVRDRLLKLTGAHLEYVAGCMRKVTSKVRNVRAYMLTALYNALDTMGHYYQLEVQHDLLYAPPAGDVPDLAEGGAHSSGGGGDGGEPAWGRWAGGCCAQGLAAPG